MVPFYLSLSGKKVNVFSVLKREGFDVMKNWTMDMSHAKTTYIPQSSTKHYLIRDLSFQLIDRSISRLFVTFYIAECSYWNTDVGCDNMPFQTLNNNV